MILYLHGFNSSAASTKAQQTLAAAKQAQINCQVPDLPHRPNQVQQLMTKLGTDRAQPIVAVGSSLGGYYATWMVENNLADHGVLINPAVAVASKLVSSVGKEMENYYSDEKYLFTEAHITDLQQMAISKIATPARYTLLVQTADDILDYQEAVTYYAGAKQIVEEGGNHSFEGFERHLPMILQLEQSLQNRPT